MAHGEFNDLRRGTRLLTKPTPPSLKVGPVVV
jgi:hypothetical protein